MDFRVLKTFDVVASFMSFNRASEVLHCAQSTVSAQIKSLEDDLGITLFERLGRRVALTPAGDALRHHTRRLLSYEHDIRAAVREVGETVGLISLRAPQSVAEQHLPAILRRCSEASPRVGFDVSNCGYNELPEELRRGEIDAGFIFTMPIEAADIICEEMMTEPIAYVAIPSSELAKRADLTALDLAGHTLLLPKHDCAYRMTLQLELQAMYVDTAAIVELNSVTAVVQCALAGIGVALLPERTIAKEIAEGTLKKLRWHEPLNANLFFIRHKDKPLAGAYGAFVEMVGQYFTELRALETLKSD